MAQAGPTCWVGNLQAREIAHNQGITYKTPNDQVVIVLEGNTMVWFRSRDVYFSSRGGSDFFQAFALPLHSVQLSAAAVVPSENEPNRFHLQDSLFSKYTFETQSTEDRDEWVRMLGLRAEDRESSLARRTGLGGPLRPARQLMQRVLEDSMAPTRERDHPPKREGPTRGPASAAAAADSEPAERLRGQMATWRQQRAAERHRAQQEQAAREGATQHPEDAPSHQPNRSGQQAMSTPPFATPGSVSNPARGRGPPFSISPISQANNSNALDSDMDALTHKLDVQRALVDQLQRQADAGTVRSRSPGRSSAEGTRELTATSLAAREVLSQLHAEDLKTELVSTNARVQGEVARLVGELEQATAIGQRWQQEAVARGEQVAQMRAEVEHLRERLAQSEGPRGGESQTDASEIQRLRHEVRRSMLYVQELESAMADDAERATELQRQVSQPGSLGPDGSASEATAWTRVKELEKELATEREVRAEDIRTLWQLEAKVLEMQAERTGASVAGSPPDTLSFASPRSPDKAAVAEAAVQSNLRAAAEAKIRSLEGEVATQNTRIETLEGLLADASAKSDDLIRAEAEASSTQERLAQEREDLAAGLASVAAQESQMIALREHVQRLTKEKEESQDGALQREDKLRTELVAVQQKCDELSSELENAKGRALDGDAAKQAAAVLEVQGHLTATGLRDKLQQAEVEREKQQQKHVAELRARDATIAQLVSDLEAAVQQIVALQSGDGESERATEEAKFLRKQLSSTREEAEHMQRSSLELVDQHRSEAETMALRLVEAEREVNETKSTNDVLARKLQAAERDAGMERAKNAELSDHVDSLRRQLTEATQSLTDASPSKLAADEANRRAAAAEKEAVALRLLLQQAETTGTADRPTSTVSIIQQATAGHEMEKLEKSLEEERQGREVEAQNAAVSERLLQEIAVDLEQSRELVESLEKDKAKLEAQVRILTDDLETKTREAEDLRAQRAQPQPAITRTATAPAVDAARTDRRRSTSFDGTTTAPRPTAADDSLLGIKGAKAKPEAIAETVPEAAPAPIPGSAGVSGGDREPGLMSSLDALRQKRRQRRESLRPTSGAALG